MSGPGDRCAECWKPRGFWRHHDGKRTADLHAFVEPAETAPLCVDCGQTDHANGQHDWHHPFNDGNRPTVAAPDEAAAIARDIWQQQGMQPNRLPGLTAAARAGFAAGRKAAFGEAYRAVCDVGCDHEGDAEGGCPCLAAAEQAIARRARGER